LGINWNINRLSLFKDFFPAISTIFSLDFRNNIKTGSENFLDRNIIIWEK